jgi:hypothetical protein
MQKPDQEKDFSFSAKWIAPSGSADMKNCYFRTQSVFNLAKKHNPIVLYISAESYYVCYCNGKEIGCGPARGSHTNNYFDAWKLDNHVKYGQENYLSVLVQCMNQDTYVTAPSQPALIAEIPDIIKTDCSWKTQIASDWRRDTLQWTMQVGFSQWRDLRLSPCFVRGAWNTRNWECAMEISNDAAIYSKKLLPRAVPLLKCHTYRPAELIKAVSTQKLKDANDLNLSDIRVKEPHFPLPETWVKAVMAFPAAITLLPEASGCGICLYFDFKRELIGQIDLDISAPSGTIIDIAQDEAMLDGRFGDYRSNNDTYNMVDRYICRDGRHKVGNLLHERGFRMLQIVIRNFSEPVTLHGLRVIDRRYDFPAPARFSCSDSTLNKIWKVAINTMQVCCTDVFTDCPWREHAFWLNDNIVDNKIAMQLFGDYRINRRAFRLAFSDLVENGLLSGLVPCPRDGITDKSLCLLATNLFVPLMLKDYLDYSGDKKLIRELLPEVYRILRSFDQWRDADGMICPPPDYWNFFDWSFEINNLSLSKKSTSLLNFLFIYALKTAHTLNRHAGCNIDDSDLMTQLPLFSENCRNLFYDQSRGCFADWLNPDGTLSVSVSQLAQAFAILSGELPPHQQNDIATRMDDESLLVPELYLHAFLFQALQISGQEAAILRRIRRYWGEMVKQDDVSLWEFGVYNSGKKNWNGVASLCHAFSTSPVDFLQTQVLGVKPLHSGFKAFVVEPKPFDLQYAAGTIPTPHGNIHIKWIRKSNTDSIIVKLEVPEGTIAETAAGILSPGRHEFNL